MFVAERIRIQRDISRALKQAKLPLHPQISAVNAALENVKRVEARLKAFNAKHPFLSKFLWIIDLLTAYIPLKSKRMKLLKLSKRIAVVAKPIVLPPPVEVIPAKPADSPIIISPPTPAPIDRPSCSYSTLLESFKKTLYFDEGLEEAQKKAYALGIEICHFCVQCEMLFNSLMSLHEQILKQQPDFEESEVAKAALETTDQFGKIYTDLLRSINSDELGCTLQQNLYDQLKMSWRDVRKSLASYPKEGLFKILPSLIRQVSYSIYPDVISARSFLEQEIWTLTAMKENDAELLAKIPLRALEDETFKGHDEQLKKVIKTHIEACNTYVKNYVYLAENLFRAPEITGWELCLPKRSEVTARENYSKYVHQALEAEPHRLSFFKFWGMAVEEEITNGLKQRFKRFKEAQALIAKR